MRLPILRSAVKKSTPGPHADEPWMPHIDLLQHLNRFYQGGKEAQAHDSGGTYSPVEFREGVRRRRLGVTSSGIDGQRLPLHLKNPARGIGKLGGELDNRAFARSIPRKGSIVDCQTLVLTGAGFSAFSGVPAALLPCALASDKSWRPY